MHNRFHITLVAVLTLAAFVATSYLVAIRFDAQRWISDYPQIYIKKLEPNVISVTWKNFPNRLHVIQVWTSSSGPAEEIPRYVAADWFSPNTKNGNLTIALDGAKEYAACSSRYAVAKVGSSRTYTNLPCYEWKYRQPRENTREALRFDEGGWGILFVIMYLFDFCLLVGTLNLVEESRTVHAASDNPL